MTTTALTGEELFGAKTSRVVTARELAWRKFRRHKLAIAATAILVLTYLATIFASFFAPYLSQETLPHVNMAAAEGPFHRQ